MQNCWSEHAIRYCPLFSIQAGEQELVVMDSLSVGDLLGFR